MSDCNAAFYYVHRIVFVDPGQSDKVTFEKECGPFAFALADGTPIKLVLQHGLSLTCQRPGERVDFAVVDPITLKGLLVVPKGGVAWGEVAKSQPKRRLLRGEHQH